MTLKSDSLAVLIDCWDRPINPLHKIPSSDIRRNILSFIDSSNINTVVMASYSCPSDMRAQNIWNNNYHKLFNSSEVPNDIFDLYQSHLGSSEHLNGQDEEHTHQDILKYYNRTKFQISMLWLWELKYYLKINPEIKNIYVFGAVWEICVKDRPLGYLSLSNLEGINILTDTRCVKTIASTEYLDLSQDKNWIQLDDTIYKFTRTGAYNVLEK